MKQQESKINQTPKNAFNLYSGKLNKSQNDYVLQAEAQKSISISRSDSLIRLIAQGVK